MHLRPLFTLALSMASIGTAAAALVGDNPVVVDPAGVYMRATRLNDGSIIGGYAAVQGANKALLSVHSTDGGASWQALGTVTSVPAAQHEVDNAFPLQLPSGRVLFAFRNHDKDSNGNFIYYRLTVTHSEDGGRTWQFLSQIEERPKSGVNGLWEPFLRVDKSGNVQAYYSSENAANDQDNLVKTSTDGGSTWSSARIVSGGGITSRDGMASVAAANDGTLMCIFENTESGPFSVNSVLSNDDGASWDSRTRVYTAAGGKEAGAPYIINVGGTLIASFMTNEDTNTPHLDGGQMKALVSTDGGRSWGGKTVTGPAGSHWEGTYALDGSFLALYSLNGQGLLSQRYTIT